MRAYKCQKRFPGNKWDEIVSKQFLESHFASFEHYNSRFQVQQPFPEIVEYFSNRYNSKRFTQIGIVIVGIINFRTGSCPSDNSCFSGVRYCLVEHKVRALSYMF